MALQALLMIGYELVRHSWIVSTVITKYFLLGVIIETLIEQRSIDRLEENLLVYRNEFVVSVVLLGALTGLTGITLEPMLKLFSQFTALVYFGYLFWKY